jgi:ribonuclease R
LVGAYKLAPAVKETRLPVEDETAFVRIGEAISAAERRAMEAERETIDRYVAAYLSTRVGELVDTRITGVQPFGFFATVVGLGGDGLVPISTLGREYFRYDEASHALEGEQTGTRYTSGMHLKLRLAEANPISGALRFEIEDAEGGSSAPRARRNDRTAPRRGRPGNIRHNGKRR